MADPTWKNYIENVGYEPNELVKRVVAKIPRPERQHALDLGCGNGRDSLYLHREGFELVVAVDSSPDAPTVLGAQILHQTQTIEDAMLSKNGPGFTEAYDLVIAMNSLFFLEKKAAADVIAQMYKALRPGGFMAFNVLGDDDEWVTNSDKKVSWFYEHEIERFEHHFHSIYAARVKEAGHTIGGKPKYWHTHSLICKKK